MTPSPSLPCSLLSWGRLLAWFPCRFRASSPKTLSAVVVDEMHLIGDKARGFLLELMLTKTRLLCPDQVQASSNAEHDHPMAHIVGLCSSTTFKVGVAGQVLLTRR